MQKSLNLLNAMELKNFDPKTVINGVAVEKRKPGRPVVNDSMRQLKLAAQATKIQLNGGVVKRGRPIVNDSKRQQVLAERAAKIEAGIEIKRGRPKTKVNLVELMNQLKSVAEQQVIEPVVIEEQVVVQVEAPTKKKK